MNDNFAIQNLCDQLSLAVGRIRSMTESMVEPADPLLVETYEDMRMTELEHVQILTLTLTKLIAPAVPDTADAEDTARGDGSAFMPGELTHEKGEVEEPEH